MADGVVSALAKQLIAIVKEQIQNEIHLVLGVDKELLNLSDELEGMRIMLDDAENRRFKQKDVNYWLVRLEQTCHEMEDVLDEWKYAILKIKMEREQSDETDVALLWQKVCSFIPSSCLCLKETVVRHDIAKKIQTVKAQLDDILKEKDRYSFERSRPATDPSSQSWRVQSTSFVDLGEVYGRNRDRDILVTKLIANGGSQEQLGIHILSIVGVGGLGKTTLAQLVYNDSQVEKSFDLRIWVCVSDPFDLAAIAKGIIERVKKGDSPTTNNLETLLHCVRDCISGKKFLLVLDDVWTEDSNKWEPLKTSLKYGGAGSKILVTTRNQRVAKTMGTMEDGIHHLGKLSDEKCWLLLRRIALTGRNGVEIENFEDVGKRIANEKCNGLPLAAKTLGSLLRFRNSLEDWENVLNSELWQLEEAKVNLFPHLLLSYNELSPTLKRCFSYCAVFPKDFDIDVEDLIRSWIALGYLGSNIGSDMELNGRECFNILANRSLFQDFERSYLDGEVECCKMHDIVCDFAQFLRKNGRVEAAGINKKNCEACDPSLFSTINQFNSLFWVGECPPKFCDCLRCLRVLSLSRCVPKGIPQGMENLIHLRWLDLGYKRLSHEDLKIIFQLYNLQFLYLSHCSLEEIPREIGNLIYLRHLDLSNNWSLKELPESICGLGELRTLNIESCDNLNGLPEGIHGLINLKHIYNLFNNKLCQIPQGLAQLTGLRTLSEFPGGNGRNKLGLLKNLNCLTGSIDLWIRLTNDSKGNVVEDAREADLRKKKHIQQLDFTFEDEMDEEESSVWMDVMDALEPHSGLQYLTIYHYRGCKLPSWITSPINKLRHIKLHSFDNLSSLPSFGKLPCLEEITIDMEGLKFVGPEFLGITTGGGEDMDAIQSSSYTIACFPKLKKLRFERCLNWKEWEDITAEEEDSMDVLLMPCLTELSITNCEGLTVLPHRLLLKVSSTLEKLDISESTLLQQRYGDKDGSAWKSISQQNPCLQLIPCND